MDRGAVAEEAGVRDQACARNRLRDGTPCLCPESSLTATQCLTEDGSELTRVSVVDSKGTRVYDSLVKPDKPITDYLTR